MADWSVIPPDHNRVGLELLPGQDRFVLLEPQILRLPQQLELLVEQRQDPEGFRQPTRFGKQVELKS